MARVCTAALSDPASASVRAKEVTISPDAMPGQVLRRFWSSGVPNITRPWLPMPTLVPKADRKAGLAWPSAIATRHSSSMERSSPPYSSGIERPNRPSARISASTFSGMASFSATLASIGRRRSATKRFTVSSS